MTRARTTVFITASLVGLLTIDGGAADLESKTIAAFDRYVKLSEAGMQGNAQFLRLDTLPASQQRDRKSDLLKGRLYIERLATQDGGKKIDAPDALIHHWIGAVFVPGAKVDEAVRLMQDYDRHGTVFQPAIARSKVIERRGDDFKIFLRFHMKKILTVVVNSEHVAHFERVAPDRARSRIYSTRIAQVDDYDTPDEREKPVGQDDGYLWRLNSYWRFLERDGGTYVQCESISLSRNIPWGLRLIIGPFVNSVPRESLTFMLERVRATLRPGA